MPTSISRKRRRRTESVNKDGSENDDNCGDKVDLTKHPERAKNHLVLASSNARKRDLVAAFGGDIAVAAKRFYKKLDDTSKLKKLKELRDVCHVAIDTVLKRIADDCEADFEQLSTRDDVPKLNDPEALLENLVAAMQKSKKNSIENKTLRATLCQSLPFQEIQKVTPCAKNTFLKAKEWYKILMDGESLEAEKVSRRCFDPAVVDDALINWILSPRSVGLLTSGSKFIKLGDSKDMQKVCVPAYTLQVEKTHLWTKYHERKRANEEGFVSRGNFFEIMKLLTSVTIHKKPPEFCIESLLSEPLRTLNRIVSELLKSDMIFCHKYVPRLKNLETWMLHGFMKHVCKENELTHNSDYAMARAKYRESQWLERYGKPPCTCIYCKEPFFLLDKLRTHPFIQASAEALQYVYDCYDKFEFYMGRVQAELSIRRKKRKPTDEEGINQESIRDTPTKIQEEEDKNNGYDSNFDEIFQDNEETTPNTKIIKNNIEEVSMEEIQHILDNDANNTDESKTNNEQNTSETNGDAKEPSDETIPKEDDGTTATSTEEEKTKDKDEDEPSSKEENEEEKNIKLNANDGNQDEKKKENEDPEKDRNGKNIKEVEKIEEDKNAINGKNNKVENDEKKGDGDQDDNDSNDDEDSVVRVYGITSSEQITPKKKKKKKAKEEPDIATITPSSKPSRPPQRKDMLSYAVERVREKDFLTPTLNLKASDLEELKSYEIPSHLFQLGYATRRPTAKTYGELYVDKYKKDIKSILEEVSPNPNLFAEQVVKALGEKYPKRFRFPSEYAITKVFSSSLTHRIYPKSPDNSKMARSKPTSKQDGNESVAGDNNDDLQSPKKKSSTRFWKLDENQDIVKFIEEFIRDLISFEGKFRVADLIMRVKERFPDRSLPNDNVLKNKVGSLYARILRTPNLNSEEWKNQFHSPQEESESKSVNESSKSTTDISL